MAAALTAAALIAALVLQGIAAWGIAWSNDFLGARPAADELAIQAGAALGIGLLALVVPAGRRALVWPIALPGLFAVAVLAVTGIAGGRIWDMVVVVLTLACAHGIGALVLGRVLGLERLSRMTPVTIVTGLGFLGVAVFALGRLGILELWSAGLPVAIGGAVVLARGARGLGGIATRALASATASRVRAAVAGLLLLQLGFVAVYTAAPEIQFDAVYAKAWLPAHWAATGEITPLIEHPILNNTGNAPLIGTPGHLLGSEAVGRYLQLAAVGIVVVALWRFYPLVALAVAVTPQIFWQASTAYDDALLALAALALSLAALELAGARRPWRAGLALGLVGGTCVAFKYSLVPLVAGVAIAWLFLGPRGDVLRRLGGAAAGVLAIPIWALVVRWIDTGNPVFPQLNNVFRSPYYPPSDERWYFPYWDTPGSLGPLNAIWKAIADPSVMLEAAPKGAMGVLALALPLAVIVGWRTRFRGGIALWIGLIVALVAWWVQFRYLRYLLPAAVVALILIAGAIPRERLRLGRAASVPGVAAAALLTALFFSTTIASFWNVPGRDIPFRVAAGQVAGTDYLRQSQSLPELDTMLAFNAVAPPDAVVASDGHARTLLRDDRDLTPIWELYYRQLAEGGVAVRGDDAFERYRRLGVDWMIVADANRQIGWTPYYVSQLLAEHGEPVFGDKGYDLYRLVDRPSEGRSLTCDPTFAARVECWSGLDGMPGLTGAENPGGSSRILPACAGETFAVDVRTAEGGPTTTVFVIFDDPDPDRGVAIASLQPDTLSRLLATAPPGTSSATVTIQPNIGAAVLSAEIHAFGPACAGSAG